jgi:hypothetical protein
MCPERRLHRSHDADRALRRWLAAVTGRTRVAGLVLADGEGLVIAASLSRRHAEELAALAPLLVRRNAAGRRPLDLFEMPISVAEVELGWDTLLLCAVGEVDCREAALEEAAAGVRRIVKELVGLRAA